MASRSNRRTGPFWHDQLQQRYWYDTESDCLIFEDGRSLPRPDAVPRSRYVASPPSTTAYQYQSPSRETAYIPANGESSRAAGSGPSVGRTLSYGQQQVAEQTAMRGPRYSTADITNEFGSMSVAPSNPQGQNTTTESVRYNTALPQQQQAPQQVHPQQQQQAIRPYVPTSTRPNEYQHGNATFVKIHDPSNEVTNLFQTQPPEAITDPELYAEGVRAHRSLLPIPRAEEEETLFNTFKLRPHPRNFFTVGKVFMVLWVEPAGESSRTLATSLTLQPGTTPGRYGEMVYSKVRRFVVIRAGKDFCSALPIVTYGGRGVGKPGVTKSDHAIIYSGRVAPSPLESEEPRRGEQPMRMDAIRVDLDNPEDKLDPRSRLDLAKVHTIHHNIRVRNYGKVNNNSMRALVHQFSNVWHPSATGAASASGPSAGPSARRQSNTPAMAAARRTSGSGGQRPESLLSATGVRSNPSSATTGSRSTGTGEGLGDRLSRIDSQQSAGAAMSEMQRRTMMVRTTVQRVMQQRNCSQEEATRIVNAELARRQRQSNVGNDEDDDDADDDGEEAGDDSDDDDEEDEDNDENTRLVFSHDY